MNRLSAPYPQNLVNDLFTQWDQPVDCILSKEEQNKLDLVLQESGVKDRAIVILYYKDNLSMNKIAKQFDISVSRVSQLLAKNIRRLRHPANFKRFWDGYSEWNHNSLKRVKCLNCSEHMISNGKWYCPKYNVEIDPRSSCELVEFINKDIKSNDVIMMEE